MHKYLVCDLYTSVHALHLYSVFIFKAGGDTRWCVCVWPPQSDSLRKHSDTLIHADGEIRVKHGRHCHRSLTAEERMLQSTNATVLLGRPQSSEEKQSPRTP